MTTMCTQYPQSSVTVDDEQIMYNTRYEYNIVHRSTNHARNEYYKNCVLESAQVSTYRYAIYCSYGICSYLASETNLVNKLSKTVCERECEQSERERLRLHVAIGNWQLADPKPVEPIDRINVHYIQKAILWKYANCLL